MKQHTALAVAALLALTTAGCTALPRNAVPLDEQLVAEVPGMHDIRAISGIDNASFDQDIIASEAQYRKHRGLSPRAKLNLDLLVISGGGDYGAFGAGIINGWTRSGKRPEFKLVTGVSTGALIAPFAYLGPEYDDALKEAYTTVSADDIYKASLPGLLWRDSFLNTEPLARLIERYIDQEFLDKVAEAHRQGRRLWIGTANLDADRLVVWNMGAIAQSDHPDAAELFRKVILASTSIPGAFPPVMIDVEINGKPHDEMHVDGGVKAQLFINADTMNLAELGRRYQHNPAGRPNWRIFVIRNAQVGPTPRVVERKLAGITSRSFTSLLKSQARSDLERIHIMSKEYGIDFSWISLPADYQPATEDLFDTVEMNKMYRIGYELGKRGDAWRKSPPQFGGN